MQAHCVIEEDVLCIETFEECAHAHILYMSTLYVGTTLICSILKLGNGQSMVWACHILCEPQVLRNLQLFSKLTSQNWICLVGKILVSLPPVFCNILEPPNCHIVQNPKKARKVTSAFVFLDIPY